MGIYILVIIALWILSTDIYFSYIFRIHFKTLRENLTKNTTRVTMTGESSEQLMKNIKKYSFLVIFMTVGTIILYIASVASRVLSLATLVYVGNVQFSFLPPSVLLISIACSL